MTDYLSRESILDIQDCKTEEVYIPEWNGTVIVRELTASEADNVGFGVLDEHGEIDVRKAKGKTVQIVSWATIDESGNKLFTPKDVKALGEKSRTVIERLADKIMHLSGLAKDDEEGEEEKNE